MLTAARGRRCGRGRKVAMVTGPSVPGDDAQRSPSARVELSTLPLLILIFRDKVRLSVGGSPAACQSRRRTARPRWCNALSPRAVHQAGPAGSRVLLQVQ
jgi:hypothetical protein